MKKVIYPLFLILWMVIIFYLSHQSGDISGGSSSGILKSCLEIFYNIFNLSKDNLEFVYKSLHHPIRELMHSIEYSVLAFFTIKTIISLNIKGNKYLLTILFCFVYAAFDEVHQAFIPGRTFEYFDILMDIIGIIFVCGCYKLFNVYKRTNKIKKTV